MGIPYTDSVVPDIRDLPNVVLHNTKVNALETDNDIEAGGLKITGVADVGSLTTNSIDSDKDGTGSRHYFGCGVVGDVRYQNNGDAGFAQKDNKRWDKFALLQNTDGGTSINSAPGNAVGIKIGWFGQFFVSTTQITCYRDFVPGVVNYRDLGKSSARWRKLWCQEASINNSDDRLKINERPINNSLELLRQIKFYEYEKVHTLNGTDVTGTERGVIAQELLLTELAYAVKGGGMEEVEKIDDDNKTSTDTVETPYGVAYHDIFITIAQAVKDLDAIVQAQQSKIDSLEARLAFLEK